MQKQTAVLLAAFLLLPVVTHEFSLLGHILSNCEKTQYACDDGSCIEETHVCDGIVHCPDASDEEISHCEYVKCLPPKYFKCGDGKCIHSNTSVCDGSPDCSDGSDEEKCSGGTPSGKSVQKTCQTTEFRCSDEQCIPQKWLCDGEVDCSDDETVGCALKRNCDTNEFMCTKVKQCFPKTYQCDGFPDCKDGSDELHCDAQHQPIDMTNCTKRNNKFACKDNFKCIGIQSVCDGKTDCYDNSDEQNFCHISTPSQCANCTHRCVNTPDGGLCLCDTGYVLGEHNDCIDVNECETYGICDQKCINTDGSFHCACDPDYILQVDGRTCFIKGGEGILVYALSHAIKELTLKNRNQYLYFEGLPFTIGVSAVGEDLYWTHGGNGSQSVMKAMNCKNEECVDREMIVTNGLGTPEDVAVDWITRNIYFSDNQFKHIAVCSSDGYVCTALHGEPVVDKPRDISLIPERGLMFWTDWGKKPHIGRSGMDGLYAIEFVSDDIKWPNGIAIDVPNDRLYWVDAHHSRVETIRLDQTDRRIVLADSIHHPLSVAVFENKLYWSDLKDREIHSCNKFTGKDRQSITREHYDNIHVIHIRHPLLEQTRVNNPCSRRPCSDLCLLAPGSKSPSFSCACPSNKNLSNDSSRCVKVHENPQIVAVKKNHLYHIEHKPLGRSKISSYSLPDEVYITATTYNSRQDVMLLADSSSKVIYSYDFQYKTLEPLITHRYGPLGLVTSMEYDEFGNNLYWCDADSGSVEAFSLTTSSQTVIVEGKFAESPVSIALAPQHGFMFVAYENVSQDVHIERISMDGNKMSRMHIAQGLRDIKLHFNKELNTLFWANTDTGEIESVNVDGTNRAKLDVADAPVSLTSSGGILFWSVARSPTISWRNFYTNEYSRILKLGPTFDSQEGEMLLTVVDKSEKPTSGCAVDNGECSHLCLASDELESAKVCACPAGLSISTDGRRCVKPKTCSLDEFACFTGECLPKKHLCDNKKDCIHGEDEDLHHCNGPKCPSDQFLCSDQSRCIDSKQKCDGHIDCDDKSDEICLLNCTSGEFACDSGECIDRQFRCDLKVDCRDAQDEYHCASVECGKNEFRCNSGQCIPGDWKCDMEPDCADGSDEFADVCEQNDKCSPHEFRCSNEKCVHMSLTCNGFDDCGDDSDEYLCFSRGDHDVRHHDYVFKLCNPKIEFFCASNERHCIPLSARCNGTKECARGEDEEHCFNNTNPCTAGIEFFCALHHDCIPMERVCDSNDDCGDGSDESRDACFQKPAKSKSCSGFKCNSGECISLSKVCNNIADCMDKSDENGKCDSKCEDFTCSQKCFSTPHGPECRCKNGYELSSDNRTCVDVNECKMDICAQNCTNTEGGFSCACYTPEYRLRRDRVSCKAVGPSFKFVVASKDALFVTSSNLKHTTELSLGHHLFSTILKVDIDVVRDYVYVLLENGILEKVSIERPENRTQFFAPQTTDFAVDWVTEIVFFVHNQRSINVTNINEVGKQKEIFNIRLYTSQKYFYVTTLSVDPVAGYLFWFENELDDVGNVGMIRRADCTGANVVTLLAELWYPVRQLVVDSFNRHLYWFDLQREAIHRMNYDASSIESVLHSEGEMTTFTFFENSIYFISPGFITIRKCRIYGLPPKKCEFVKVNMHKIRHLNILQPSRQRMNARVSCKENVCSQHGLCLMTPNGPQCVCSDGKIENKRVICSRNGSFSSYIGDSDSRPFSAYFAYFVIFCILVGLSCMIFSHFSKRKGEILHRFHFRNPVYATSKQGKASASQALLKAEERPYENHPIFEESKSILYDDDRMSTSGREAFVQTLKDDVCKESAHPNDRLL